MKLIPYREMQSRPSIGLTSRTRLKCCRNRVDYTGLVVDYLIN